MNVLVKKYIDCFQENINTLILCCEEVQGLQTTIINSQLQVILDKIHVLKKYFETLNRISTQREFLYTQLQQEFPESKTNELSFLLDDEEDKKNYENLMLTWQQYCIQLQASWSALNFQVTWLEQLWQKFYCFEKEQASYAPNYKQKKLQCFQAPHSVFLSHTS